MVDKSIIGTEMGGGSMVVERGKIMEFARAILDENPVYFEENAPAPPTFTMAGAHWPSGSGGGGAKLADLGLDRPEYGPVEKRSASMAMRHRSGIEDPGPPPHGVFASEPVACRPR